MKRTGTREWSDVSKNLYQGCYNQCRYCYARAQALRFGVIKTADDWFNMRLAFDRFEREIAKPPIFTGTVMFPTAHDLFIEHIDNTVKYLRALLSAGNSILIVSKPREEVIRELCTALVEWKNQILFRFTIGTPDNTMLKFWEPNAPTYTQRINALALACSRDFKTSISMEPLLGGDSDVQTILHDLGPFVTDKIWVGLMNRMDERVDFSKITPSDYEHFVSPIERCSKTRYVKAMYENFQSQSKIAWKDSIKRIVGIPLEEKK